MNRQTILKYEDYVNEDIQVIKGIIVLGLATIAGLVYGYDYIQDLITMKKYEKLIASEPDAEKKSRLIKYYNKLHPDIKKIVLDFEKLKQEGKLNDEQIDKVGRELLYAIVELKIKEKIMPMFLKYANMNVNTVCKKYDINKNDIFRNIKVSKLENEMDFDSFIYSSYEFLSVNGKLGEKEKNFEDYIDANTFGTYNNMIPTNYGDGDENLFYYIKGFYDKDLNRLMVKYKEQLRKDLRSMTLTEVIDKYKFVK